MASLLLAVIYLAFVSLGLPDSLLGSAWPVMYVDLGAPVALQSVISTTIAVCTIISSLLTTFLVRHLGTGKTTALSVAINAVAILGFGFSNSFWQLCLFAIPYGLGAGGIDAALNNYVALHYGSRHLSWLHCCWGIGTSVSPLIMGWALAGSTSWHGGYLIVGVIQALITLAMVFSLPLWKEEKGEAQADDAEKQDEVTFGQALAMPGAKAAIVSFFSYSAFEYVTTLWSSSYLVLARGISEAQAATMASFFFLGIMAGRFVAGVLAPRIGSKNLVRIGQCILTAALVVLLVAPNEAALSAALVLLGLGCAPIYPNIVAMTPERFGEKASQTQVSLLMVGAYVGSSCVPPLCALMMAAGKAVLMPALLGLILVLMVVFAEVANRRVTCR